MNVITIFQIPYAPNIITHPIIYGVKLSFTSALLLIEPVINFIPNATPPATATTIPQAKNIL